ncbi:hypothetical protein EV44_g3968 [Erysiphe necator]|uniref:RNase H type-1 domain-containing protein n=1 Tax=Uncinula necator TaxID=52586 RepID=A0A0B1P1H9_UNCNE|nr:hypothetical protein EV44_g3968 [Erysiphe necator]
MDKKIPKVVSFRQGFVGYHRQQRASDKALQHEQHKSSQKAHIDALGGAKMWKSRPRLPHITAGKVNIRWISGHSGITGNELTGCETKGGSFSFCYENHLNYSYASPEKWHALKILKTKD